jgi:hypothetical protein
MQQKIPPRIVIYAIDVMNITGRKVRAARKLLAKIKKKYNKKNQEFVSIKEFSEFTGLEPELIKVFLV